MHPWENRQASVIHTSYNAVMARYIPALTHNAGKGAKYTRSRTPVKLVYLEQADTKKRAMQREAQIKRLSRYEKEQLIRSSTNGSTV